mmetsp:Transcript_29253/g.33518  ORF Transcript_29253/g.33518 Transcript_29253/m.33518 type:complete len:282 (+) Transcript_29253:474-1319(+)
MDQKAFEENYNHYEAICLPADYSANEKAEADKNEESKEHDEAYNIQYENYVSYTNSEYCEENTIDTQSMPTQPAELCESIQFEREAMFYEALAQEIEVEASEIIRQVNLITDYRLDIKNVLKNIVLDTFSAFHQNVQAHIYGSVATGLALPESDMDIVVMGINCFGNRDTHVANIVSLYNNIVNSFEDNVLVKHKKIVDTQVPIIKLEFCLEEYYNDKLSHGIMNLPYINFSSEESINPVLRVLAVDISICDSFNTDEHQGMKAANFIESNLIEYPVLKSV